MDNASEARRSRLRLRVVAFAGLMAAIAVVYLACEQCHLYSVLTLPSYGGEPFSPCAMNDHGQIVGVVATAGGGHSVALWDRQQGIRELRIVACDGSYGINNCGQVAGITVDPNGGTRAFLWDPQTGLTLLGQRGSRACAINNRGQVVGDSGMEPGPPHAVLWEGAHGMRDLNPPDAQASMAECLNDSGQILGRFGVDGGLCLWDPANPNFTDWMSLPGEGGACNHELNNGGYVLGEEFRLADGKSGWPQRYAMLWHKDRDPVWLFPLADLNAHVAFLNDANQVVYCESHRPALARWFPRWFPPRESSFLWDPTRGRIPLDGYLRLGRTDRFGTSDLNNGGCIVGVVSSDGGVKKRTVLLEPIEKRWRR
ncbi:MAG: hypothetical protein ABFE13_15275 [Phycisphaerales bacterium]